MVIIVRVMVSWVLPCTAANPGESPATAPATAQNAFQDQAQQPSQIRVTRMVFRVIPAGFVSSSPTAIRTRDGWLVIQM